MKVGVTLPKEELNYCVPFFPSSSWASAVYSYCDYSYCDILTTLCVIVTIYRIVTIVIHL